MFNRLFIFAPALALLLLVSSALASQLQARDSASINSLISSSSSSSGSALAPVTTSTSRPILYGNQPFQPYASSTASPTTTPVSVTSRPGYGNTGGSSYIITGIAGPESRNKINGRYRPNQLWLTNGYNKVGLGFSYSQDANLYQDLGLVYDFSNNAQGNYVYQQAVPVPTPVQVAPIVSIPTPYQPPVPSPVYQTPAPVYQAPAPPPVYQTPAPVYQAPPPAPVYQAPPPPPMYQAPPPAPVYQVPAPVYQAPAPAPVYQAPPPVYQQPAPAPVYQAPAPAPVYQAPTPTSVTQAPVSPVYQTPAPSPLPIGNKYVFASGFSNSYG